MIKSIQLSISLIFLLTLSSCANLSSYNQINNEVTPRSDGGYSLILRGHTQYLLPVSAEGVFPKQSMNYEIELIGLGKDLSFRNQPGYLYFPEDIICKNKHWDFGYAWVDKERKNIYLNFYWIDSPDSVTESRLNGKYKIEK